MPSNLERIGERIRARREHLGWTQGMLARKLHIDPGTISHYELGRREMPAGMLVEIAEELRTTVGKLLDEAEPPTERSHAPQYKLVAASTEVVILTEQEQRLLDTFVRGLIGEQHENDTGRDAA